MAREIRATYRMQLHAGFGFEAASAIAEFLAALGISHLYASPYQQAGRGSMHGYDVVNPHCLNEELGGAEAQARFCEALGYYRLGHVLDIVPNHVAIADSENPWWDVLENGPASRYAAYFDVDWDPPESRLRYSVLLPILGDHYSRVLEAGEQRLERRDAIFTIRYHDHAFLVSPRTLEALLGAAAEACRSDELGCTADALGSLPVSTATDRVTVRRRHRDKEGLGAQLTRLLAERPDVAEAVDTMISALNADPNALHTLLERQNYRLAFWRAAARDLDYRRFFDINTLVGLRMEIVVEKILEPGERLEAHQRWPQGMLATSTHDTKRSEDVRLRILLLSEIATCWAEVMRCGAALSEQDRRGGRPDRNTEYLLYQTLVGAWPLEVERALTYMEQAIREAKAHTSWTHTNADYEEAVHGVVTGVLADPQFTADLATFVAPLVQAGRVNGLAQTLLKLIAPGVPDLYQTTEVWHVSLVDPNNRRPVDYDLRRRLLSELEGATPEQMWARVDEGMPKQWLIRQALLLRHGQRERFGPQGDYQPLLAKGERAAHVVAFARGGGVVTVVPRLVLGLDGEWGSTTLQVPNGAWRNQLTGDDVDGRVTQMADLLARFPVALLSQKEGE